MMRPENLPDPDEQTSPRSHCLPRGERLAAGGVAAGAAAVLTVARLLTPDGRGLGTHEQLMLPPCLTTKLFHIPCPLCGMTTAFAHMAQGEFLLALRVQPVGALTFLLCIVVFFTALFCALTGRRPRLPSTPRARTIALRLGLAIVLGGWLYKVVMHLRG
jgi:uncharacterized protein DUF2752